MVRVGVTYGAPHHLVADAALAGGTYGVRRTRAGDAWAARQKRPATASTRAVGLGLPSVGAPPPVAAPACR
jgi:tRNA-2-methylthio-N6-dimethylallyladenosine synthase